MNKRINTPGPEPMTDEACEIVGGTLIEEYRECEGISAQTCKNIGGTFNECASACRHNPEAEICTMQCIPVCSF